MNEDDEHDRRVALNEALFREVNERLGEIGRSLDGAGDYEFVCECGDSDCTDRLTLDLDRYEAIRSSATRFVVLPGHVAPRAERVVAENDGYMVVEKTDEDAVRIVVELDPRA